MKPDLNKLKNALTKYDNERWKLQKIIRDLEEIPKIKALVGKYFKYSNSYNQTENWDLYCYIREYNKGSLVVDYFEEDTRSRFEFKTDTSAYGLGFYNPSYVEITKEEYEKAAKNILNKLCKRFK